MSGIVTIFGYRPSAPDVDPAELLAIREAMRSRGPDDAGEWYSADRRVGLGHRHLALHDATSRGHQPLLAGRFVINFDGAIYNYRELRAMLEREGVVFESDLDAEIIPRLFERRGLELLHQVRGMFAFTLVDLHSPRMLVARDSFGINPLYISDDGQTLRVASQVGALVAGGHVSNEIDPAAAAGFLLTGSVPEPFTIRREIQAVPAGHFVWVDVTGASKPKRYFALAEEYAHAFAAPVRSFQQDESIDQLSHAVRESIRHHLPGDAAAGFFLSSGAASATIAALAHDIVAAPMRTVTVAFSDYQDRHLDGLLHAEAVAKRHGIAHRTHVVTRTEFIEELPRILASMDQPSIGGVRNHFASKVATEAGVKVMLSGAGGAELFGSSAPFRSVPRLVTTAWLPSHVPGFPQAFRKAAETILPARPRVAALLQFGGSFAGAYFLSRSLFMPWELDSILGREMAEEGLKRLDLIRLIERGLDPDPGPAHARVSTLESSMHLRNQLLRSADWASMSHGIQMRFPLVDPHLLRTLAPLLLAAHGSASALFASTVAPQTPIDALPRRKAAPGIPWNDWLFEGRAATESPARTWARVVWAHFSSR